MLMTGKCVMTGGEPAYRVLLFTAGTPKANSTYGWSQWLELCTHKCLGENFGFVSHTLESRTCVYTFAYMYRYIGGFMCIILLCKGYTTKASCHKYNFFPQSSYCPENLVQLLSSCRKKCLCGILVAVVLCVKLLCYEMACSVFLKW